MLSTATEEEDHDVDSKWNTIKNIYCKTAKHIVGYRQKKIKEWLTPGTWQEINETKTTQEQVAQHCKIKSTKPIRTRIIKEVERKVRQEALYIKEHEAEQVAFGDKMSVVYKITKRI